MAQWQENKHPRDEDGKFTDGNGTPAENRRLEELGITDNYQTNGTFLNAEEKRLNELGFDDKKLNNEIDKVLNGTYKNSHITICENTPKILQNIGIPNNPLLITAKHAYLAVNKDGRFKGDNEHYHGLGKELFMMIPKLLQSPMMVLQNKDKKEVVAVLNWYDKEKNILIAPIKINGKGNKNFIEIDANIIKSAYGKQNLKNYINKNFTQADVLLVGNKKIRSLK